MSLALSSEEISTHLRSLPGWTLTQGCTALCKSFPFTNFKEAIGFVVRVAFEAEALNHHPQIENVYRTVTLTLSTHEAGNQVTLKDIELAKAIEKFNWLR